MTKKTSKLMAFAKKGLAVGLMIVLCFTLSNHVVAQTEKGASEAEIKEYKELMKKYAPEKGNTISIYKKDVDRINKIYNKMSVAQRKKYPKIELPAPPPPPTTPKAPKAEKALKVPKAPKAKSKVKEKNKWKEEQKPTPPTPPTAPSPPSPPKTPKVVKGIKAVEPISPVTPSKPKVPVVKGYENNGSTAPKAPKVEGYEGNIPPPPPPSPFEKLEGAQYYLNGEKCTFEAAQKALSSGETIKVKLEEKDSNKLFYIYTK